MPAIGAALSAAFAGLSAASTSIGALIAAGGIPAFAIRLGSSLLLSALANALSPQEAARGTRIGQQQSGEDLPFSFPVGVAATAGSLLYRGSHGVADGTPNSFYTQVIEVSSLPGAVLLRVIVDQEYTALGETAHPQYGSPLLALRRDGTDYGWVRYYNGTQTTADADLVAAYGSDPDQPWTANHILTGVCYAIITYRLDRENQFPQRIAFEMQGIPLYEPRRDSTVGGDGLHRFNDKTTWEASDNPAVIAYNLLRGIETPEGDIYGGGVDAADLPLSNWFAAMNECDRVLTGSRRQFRAGLMVDVSVDPADYLDQLAEACVGRYAEAGGVFTMRAGALPTAVVSFTDDDVSIDHPQDFTPFPGLQSVYNGVSVSHPCQTRLWEPLTTPVATDPAWVTEDQGRVLISALSFPSVFIHAQARQIAETIAADNRRFRVHQLVLPAEYGRIKALDVISWTSPRNGYVSKAFEVLEVQVLPLTLLAAFVVREVDPDDYDWDGSLDLAEPPAPTPPAIAARVIGGSEWAVVAAAVEDEVGEPRRPALRITWDAGRVIDALFVRWQVRVAATGETVSTDRGDAGDGEALVSTGIVPGVEYEVRLRPVIPGRETGWNAYKAVTAQDIYFGEGDIEPSLVQLWNDAFARHDAALDSAEGVVSELRARIEEALGSITLGEMPPIALAASVLQTADALRQTRAEINSLVTHLLETGLTDHAAREELRQELSVQVGENRASFQQIIQTMVDGDASLVIRTTALEAETEQLQALITSVDTAFAAETEALAALITALSVGTANSFDQLNIWRFDSTVEDWTGSPNAPAITVAGFIRPGAASSSLISPTVTGWNTTQHRQVRALLRQVGTPTWVGYLWYNGAGQSFDAARRIDIAAPDFSGGDAEIRVNLPTGLTVEQFRLDFVSDADGSNYIEADWIAVGSPAPGASSSEVAQEVAARIAGDNALAALITALDVRLTTAEGDVDGQVTAISGLTADVTDLDGAVTALGARTDTIEGRIDDPQDGLVAIGTAIEELATLVQNTEVGGLLVLSQSVRNLRAELQLVGAEAVEGALQAFAQEQDTVALIAEAAQNTSARIEQTNDDLRITSQSVTQLEATIPTLATATALQSLVTEVSVIDGEVTAVSGQVTNLTATVNDNTASIDTLSATRVDAAGAVAAVDQVISAEYGGMLALAQATAFAESTLDGITSGFVLSLGAGDVLSLVRVDDGVTPPVTTARITGDFIQLNGNTQVVGDFFVTNNIFAGASIQSEDFAEGSTGWRIQRSGNAEFNNLLVRGSFTADAVTDRSASANENEQIFINVDWTTVHSATLQGPRNGRNWTIFAHAEIRAQQYANGPEGDPSTEAFGSGTGWRLLRRTKWASGGSFTPFQTVREELSSSDLALDWVTIVASENIDGRFFEIEYLLQAKSQFTGAFFHLQRTNVRRSILTAQIAMV